MEWLGNGAPGYRGDQPGRDPSSTDRGVGGVYRQQQVIQLPLVARVASLTCAACLGRHLTECFDARLASQTSVGAIWAGMCLGWHFEVARWFIPHSVTHVTQHSRDSLELSPATALLHSRLHVSLHANPKLLLLFPTRTCVFLMASDRFALSSSRQDTWNQLWGARGKRFQPDTKLQLTFQPLQVRDSVSCVWGYRERGGIRLFGQQWLTW